MTQTNILNIFAGNNNCTCVSVECQGALYVAISSPDTSPSEVPVCPVNVLRPTNITSDMICYRPNNCQDFEGTSFFRICQSQNNIDCAMPYSMCFDHTTTDLSGTRLDFYVMKKEICTNSESEPQDQYVYRKYVQSFEMNGN